MIIKTNLLAVMVLLLSACVDDVASAQGTVAFGGFLNREGRPGKYFHLEKIDGRKMLVTPEGHGFFTLGINHTGDINGARPNNVVKR